MNFHILLWFNHILGIKWCCQIIIIFLCFITIHNRFSIRGMLCTWLQVFLLKMPVCEHQLAHLFIGATPQIGSSLDFFTKKCYPLSEISLTIHHIGVLRVYYGTRYIFSITKSKISNKEVGACVTGNSSYKATKYLNIFVFNSNKLRICHNQSHQA